MKIRVDVTHYLDPELERRLFATLEKLSTQQESIMNDLDKLTADVAADTSAVNAAITLLGGLTAAIKAAGTDPVALKALTDQLETNTSSLAAAVAANTPAAPTA